MSNPYDPPQNQQQWGQPAYPQQPAQGYDAGAPQATPAQGQQQWGQQQWGQPDSQGGGQWGTDQGAQSWQQPPAQPAGPAQIDWNTAPPQPGQAAWQGPHPYNQPQAPQPDTSPDTSPEPEPESAQGEPWVASGTAQTAQEVADQWQAAQPPAPAADHQQQPAADPYQPPEPQPYQPPAPEPQPYQPPAAEPQQQWPSYDAPGQNPSINEAATVTTPAVADPAAQQEEPEALTIGRGRDNSIVLDDMLVSRQHVRITADADGLVLEDLGSRNGTYVNGRRVERTHLSEGDRIGIGAATFEVRDGWLLNV